VAGAAAGGAQRCDGGGGTVSFLYLPCVPVTFRALRVPEKTFSGKRERLDIRMGAGMKNDCVLIAQALLVRFNHQQVIARPNDIDLVLWIDN
jgi:hypothetical protein